VYRKGKADSTSERQSRLNNVIQPFARYFFEAISSVQQLAVKDSNVILSPKLSCKHDNLSAVCYAFDPP